MGSFVLTGLGSRCFISFSLLKTQYPVTSDENCLFMGQQEKCDGAFLSETNKWIGGGAQLDERFVQGQT